MERGASAPLAIGTTTPTASRLASPLSSCYRHTTSFPIEAVLPRLPEPETKNLTTTKRRSNSRRGKLRPPSLFGHDNEHEVAQRKQTEQKEEKFEEEHHCDAHTESDQSSDLPVLTHERPHALDLALEDLVPLLLSARSGKIDQRLKYVPHYGSYTPISDTIASQHALCAFQFGHRSLYFRLPAALSRALDDHSETVG